MGSVTLSAEQCDSLSKDTTLKTELMFGSSLTTETDEVADNNIYTWKYPCRTGQNQICIVYLIQN